MLVVVYFILLLVCHTFNVIPLLSAALVRGRHSGFSVSILFYHLHPPPSLQPLPCPLSWRLHPQHPSPIIFAPYISSVLPLVFSPMSYIK